MPPESNAPRPRKSRSRRKTNAGRPPPAPAAKPVKPVTPVDAVKPVAPKAVQPKAVQPKAVAPKPVQPKAVEPTPAASATPPPPDPLLGQTVGRCRIEALVGVGKTARVYRAHYEALDDTVAIKILREEIARNPLLVQRFHSEARAIAKVDNENVLKIYDVGTTDDGRHYMVVELLEGEEILDLIEREGQVDVMDALRIVRQAANGLGAAHALGLVHRDIKPQNLFLLEDGTVKVVDFGLATSIEEGSERVGTPHYMAPEVCEHGSAEPASDIYGLGIVLYHLLTGQPPYAGKDIKGILGAHIKATPLRPERERPGLPKPTAEFVRHLTKREPLLRPTALEVVEELDRIGGQELKAKDTLQKRRSGSRARAAIARRERAGKGAPALVAIFGGLVIVVGLAVLVLGSGSDDPEPGMGGGTKTPERPPIVSTAPPPRETEEDEAKKAAVVAAAQREKEAADALQRTEAWARENWRVPADTEAVLAKYAYIRERFATTAAAEEARRRIKEILRKKLHPHPDKQWTSADEIAEIKAKWERARPEAQKLIAAFDYAGAQKLVPDAVSEEAGGFARELDFWRTFTGHLIEFKKAFVRGVTNSGPDDREIGTPDGPGVIVKLDADTFDIRVDNRTRTYTWSALGAERIAGLALNVFSGNVDLLLLQLAFTYANGLDQGFWDAHLEMGATAGAQVHAREMQLYERKFRELKGG